MRDLCDRDATFVRDIPNIGESLCYCTNCVNREILHYNEDFGWYLMTPEREELELASEEMMDIWKKEVKGYSPFQK